MSTLAVGLGLAAALSSVADAILFRPLPVDRPQEIVRIYTASAGQAMGFVSNPDFEDFRASSQTMAGLIAETRVLIAVGSMPAQMRMGLAVSSSYFEVLGVAPALGRTFSSPRDAVVVLAYSFWKAQFGGDRRVIGETVRLGGAPFTILGVAPAGFGLDRFIHEDFYIPMAVYGTGILAATGHPLDERGRRYLNVYGRLAHHATAAQARAEFATLAARLEAEHPETNRGRRAVVFTESESRAAVRTLPGLAKLLLAVAILLLAIAYTNVAGLMLMRAEARSREVAVLIAIGATRTRLFREGVIEGAVLAASGATLGMPLAWAAARLLARVATLPTDFGFALSPEMHLRQAAVIVGAAALAATFCGAAPVLRQPSSRGWRGVFAGLQIAFATALLACGGFVMKAIAMAGQIDPGYRAEHVLVMALDPGQVRYNEARTRAFYTDVLNRVKRLPGVRAVTLAQSVPLGYTAAQRQIGVGAELRTVWVNIVGNGYFDLLHIPIVEGRAFDQRDTATSPPVAIVNGELAKLCGSGCKFQMNGRAVNVAGVARTAKYFHLGEHPVPFLYLPFSQNYASRMMLHVEHDGSARAVIDAVHSVDAAQPVSEVRALKDYVTQGAMFDARIAVDALGTVGLCGLALALAGLYGIISRSVTRRRREIGIRMALGAKRTAVMVLIIEQGVRLAAAGTLGGLAAALAAGRWLASLVEGIDGRDFGVLAASAAMVMAASLIACMVPAWRASGMDPARALRDE